MSKSTLVTPTRGQPAHPYFDDEDIPVIKYLLKNGATMAERATDSSMDPIRGHMTAPWIAKTVTIVIMQDKANGFFVIESNRSLPRSLTEVAFTRLSDVMAELGRLTQQEITASKARHLNSPAERFPAIGDREKVATLLATPDKDAEEARWTDCGHGSVEGRYETVRTGTVNTYFTSKVWDKELVVTSIKPRNEHFYVLQVPNGTLHPSITGRYRSPADCAKALDAITQLEATPMLKEVAE